MTVTLLYYIPGVGEILRRLDAMNAAIAQFKSDVDAQFKAVSDSLDNIVNDETALAQKISDLQTQLSNSGATLSADDQATLSSVVAEAQALATRTKGVADAVPDAAPPIPVTTIS